MDANIIGLIAVTCIGFISVIGNIVAYLSKNDINYGFSLALIIIASILIGIGAIITEINGVHPLDVYAGKTELQVTYKIVNNDTISCDSIVVFKNK